MHNELRPQKATDPCCRRCADALGARSANLCISFGGFWLRAPEASAAQKGEMGAPSRSFLRHPYFCRLSPGIADEKDEMRLGIDFGTTRTVVAAVREGRYPVATFETETGFVEFLPGFASFGPDGLLYGTEAERPELSSALRSVKARITGAMPDELIHELGSSRLSALQLTTDYLRYVRRMLEEHSNLGLAPREPLEAMIAVPAHASTRQRYLTIEAFQNAGFEVLGLVNEPTAGAVEYARHTLSALSQRSPKRYVIVYDLGGGTFDTAAVSLKERRFDLIGAEGVSALGGNDFDEIILRLALEYLGLEAADLSHSRRLALLERCRIAKEGLSNSARRLYLDTSGLLEPEEVVLDVGPIYEAAAPLVARTLDAMRALFEGLHLHGIDPENARELGAIYLVGGSVQFPAVQRALRAQFGRKIQLAPQPHASTAVGLAIAADEAAGIFVREAPTRHFGVWREGEGGREKVFDPIIEKRHGAKVDGPLRIERAYRPAHAVGRLRFVECTDLDEQRTPRGEVTPWESILFPYDPTLQSEQNLLAHTERRGDHLVGEEIVETYEYAATGVIRVKIENRTRGYHRSYVLGQPQQAVG